MTSRRHAARSRVLATASVIALAGLPIGLAPAAAFAQDTGEQAEKVVVTGSRIQRQDYTANSPIVTVDESTFEDTSTIGLSTVLNQLPQFVPALDQFTASDIQPSATNTVGSSTVSLRGLGSNRSLVLIDGRRGPPINASLAVDTDSIASSAIARTEIISGGASAVYGADAIAGVVNFILKDNYEGFEVETRYGVSELGDDTEFQISSLFGANFDDGRGNVMMSLEHSSRGSAEQSERDWAQEQMADPYVDPSDFWFSEAYVARQAGGAQYDQNVVDLLFPAATACDPDGAGAGQPSTVDPDGAGPLVAPSTCPGGVPRTNSFYINPTTDGTGTIFTGVRTFGATTVPGAAGAYKYDGPLISDEVPGVTFRKIHPDGAIGQNNVITNLSRPLERYSGFARGRYEITPKLTAIAQTMFARTKSNTLSQYTAALGSNAVIIPYGDDIYAPSIGAAAPRTSTDINTLSQPVITGWSGTGATATPIFNATDVAQNFRGRPAVLGTNPFTNQPVYNPYGITNAAYLPGGAYGLDTLQGGVIGSGTNVVTVPTVTCGPVGGCSQTYVFPLPLELRALLNSRGTAVTPGSALGVGGLAGKDQDYNLNTALDFVGRRISLNETLMFQALFGFEGELWDDWTWDATISHSESDAVTDLYGDVSRERYRAVASAPNFGKAFQAVGNAAFGGQRAGQAQCTSGLPLIAKFQVSQDCLDAIQAVTHNDSNIVQNAFEANIGGDLFNLPAGPLASSFGASYRDYEYEYNVDNLQGFTSFIENSSGIRPVDPTEGYYSVSEVYGELLVPVLKDLPLIHELNLELGGRLSDYSTVGEVTTLKALGDWSVTSWARLRGGYNRATRAPNLAELFQARTSLFQGSAAQYGDQCSRANIVGPYTANQGFADANANGVQDPGEAFYNINGPSGALFTENLCKALMGEAAAEYYYANTQPNPGSAGTPNTIGNPDVDAETADTYTLGLVLTSPFENKVLSGFQGTIDYFTIELTDMIASKNPDDVYRECFDPTLNPTADPNIPACTSIIRDLVTGAALNVDTGFTNEGRSVTSGVDVAVSWRGDFSDLGLDVIPGGLSVNVQSSFNIENITQATDTAPEIDWKGTRGCALGLQCMGYDYRVFTTVNYFTGPFSASLRWRHYPSIDAGGAFREIPKPYDIYSLTGSYRLNDNFTFRAGVENLLDQEPPYQLGFVDTAGTSYDRAPSRVSTGGTYDTLGRRYFVGLTASF